MNRIFQLKISLLDVEPEIRRRVLAADSPTLRELHAVIRGAMGRRDCHLHMFDIGGRQFEIPEGDSYDPEREFEDERKQRLAGPVRARSRFLYACDFWDDRNHSVKVERAVLPEPGRSDPEGRYAPQILGRAGAREDCGGPFGYPELLQALADPDNPEYRDLADCAEGFEPEAFDLAEANAAIQAACGMCRELGWGFAKGIGFKRLIAMFPDDDRARAWFEEHMWPQGAYCPHCGSFNVQHPIERRTMTHRCRDCLDRSQCSLKSGSLMEGSKPGYRTRAIALYLVVTNLKGVSSMKLHRDLEITQKSAWHSTHRLRKGLEDGTVPMFHGPAEADETYIGGKRKNMSNAKRKELTGRGTVGKAAVAGVKDRETGQVAARRMEATDASALKGFVRDTVEPGATLYTDETAAYRGMPEFEHEAVDRSAGEYEQDMAHTNGMESFRALLKRGYVGTFHKFSEKHLDRYVARFAGRRNARPRDTLDMMQSGAAGMKGKRLRYRDLTADNGLPGGARTVA